MSSPTLENKITRRKAISILGASGAVALLGCGSGTTNTNSTSTGGTTGSSSTSTGSSSANYAVLTPNITVGPYFVDEKLNRSDLTTNTTDTNVINGVPLAIQITILQYASGSCSPFAGAQVDIWHADAGGVYSDEAVENTLGQTYLRGYQITDSNGLVSFNTIFPGWYSGRTVHIHLMIRTFSASGNPTLEFTTQLFFDDALTTSILARAPYNASGTRNTTNSTDSLYNSQTQLSLSATSSGYTSAITLAIRTS